MENPTVATVGIGGYNLDLKIDKNNLLVIALGLFVALFLAVLLANIITKKL